MRVFLFIHFILIFFLSNFRIVSAQEKIDSAKLSRKKPADTHYIERLDTMFHIQTWVSKHQMNYRLSYANDLKLVLAPNKMNSLSLGISYRYLDLSYSFTPGFLNPGQKDAKKGKSDISSFRTSFSMYRFNLSVELNSVQGFYLKNSNEFLRSLPDTPYLVFPHLKVNNFGLMLRYNANPKFSTAALTSGTQIQKKSAYTLLPTLQFATFRFLDNSPEKELQNKSTYSTDINLLLPVAGTLVLSPKFYASLGIGPSVGIDIFKSVSINDSGKLVLSKGTGFTGGITSQGAVGFNSGRLFAGLEGTYRSYGHKIEDVSRLTKQYFYFQVYAGWRFMAPGFAKKTLDWLNKVSPIDFD
ncbi:MAG: DUF4421 family protein [Chitinophagales bacterium]